MRIGIRVDANKTVATGHLMRCLAIADAWRACGEIPLFITADEYPKQLIVQRGYEYISLESSWRYMENETEKLKQVIRKYSIGLLLVDSYYVTKSYLKKLSSLTKVAYLDDLCKDVYEVDALICYANYYKDFLLETRYSSEVKLLLGTEYTPLRSAFYALPVKKISEKVKELVVMSGGADKGDFSRQFLRKIRETPLFGELEKVNVICGKYYDGYESLMQEFAEDRKVSIYKEVNAIENYMLSADVAISAGGVTLYELCAVGTPTITYIIAENQRKSAETFHRDGIMEYAGDLRNDPVLDTIFELLERKYQETEYRKRASRAMKEKVDGRGGQRIVEELEKLSCPNCLCDSNYRIMN